MTVPATVSKIYYQFGPGDTDPSDYAHSLDPRLVGGGIHPAATLIELEGGGGGPGITPFITSGADWKYLADGSNQGTAWQAPGFNDAAWPSGPSPLGYGDGDEATVVGFIDTDPAAAGDQRNATTYFRRVVNIPDPTVFADFTLTTVYDDAIVVYVNGVDHHRVAARLRLPPRGQYLRRGNPPVRARQQRHQLRPHPDRQPARQQRPTHHPAPHTAHSRLAPSPVV